MITVHDCPTLKSGPNTTLRFKRSDSLGPLLRVGIPLLVASLSVFAMLLLALLLLLALFARLNLLPLLIRLYLRYPRFLLAH